MVHIYNWTHTQLQAIPHLAKGFTAKLSEEVCRDGLEIYALLRRADLRDGHLSVTTAGRDELRFLSAMEEQLEWIALEGTSHRDHYCSRCTRITITDADGNEEIKSQFVHTTSISTIQVAGTFLSSKTNKLTLLLSLQLFMLLSPMELLLVIDVVVLQEPSYNI